MGSGKLNACSAVFVDYFDTLVFRDVTPREVIERWARCVAKKYPAIPKNRIERLPEERMAAFARLRDETTRSNSGTEVTYERALGDVFKHLFPEAPDEDISKYVSASKKIDLAIECGCGHVNRRLALKLARLKKAGKKIYCVSDFYLGRDEMLQMMSAANVPKGLVDGIFVSCDHGKRKASGDLYQFVLDELGIKANEAVMIGDNRNSDCLQARKKGLSAQLRSSLLHKIRTHLAEKLHRNYSGRHFRRSVRELYKNGMDYSEYVGMLFLFTKRLFAKLREDNVRSVAFMAREGFYLKRLFEEYEDIAVPDGERINTSYYRCSRRSVMSGVRAMLMPEAVNGEISLRNWLKSLNVTVEQASGYAHITQEQADEVSDLRKNAAYMELMANPTFTDWLDTIIEENRRAFLSYTEPFIHDGRFCFVDSGWKCTTQNTIQREYGIQTKGYYIGVQKPDEPILELDRTGLIFCEEKPRSKYYDYLGMNIPFYQQLLAASHGSALKYVVENGAVTVLSEWDPMEQRLYEDRIRELQEYMLLKFRGFCAWNDVPAFCEKEDWTIARQSMKSSLFAKGSRLAFIRECTENYVQNFRQENRGKVKYDYRKAKLGFDIVWRPEKYLRYFAKIQRTGLYDHWIVRMMYTPFSHVYYAYTVLLHSIKKLF